MRTADTGGISSESSNTSYEDLWIVRFMNKKENRYLDRIQDFFMQDRFNFHGFKEKIEDFEDAYLAIQDKLPSKSFETESLLYLSGHQRYIYTKAGLDNVLDKVLNKEYGTCPRVLCKSTPMIPLGLSNEPRKSGTKVFCHNCENLYEPRSSLRRLDGCAWGTGFAHFLILTYPYHFEKVAKEVYTPRIFGFRLTALEEEEDSS